MPLYARVQSIGLRILTSAIILTVGLSSVMAAIAKDGEIILKYNDEYSMTVQALRGPYDTEVIVTILSSDSELFPLPEALKKLQVKIKNTNNDVTYIVNEVNPEIINDQVIRFVSEPGMHEILEINALIQAGKRVDVLQSETQVQLRPDLVVLGVSAPEEIDVDLPFDVDVDIQELNAEVGATANIHLFVDGELSASYPDVHVDPSSVSTVVFSGLTFSEPGIKNLTIHISDADPDEYDETNNEYSFTIEALQAVVFQQSSYTLSYLNMDNYTHHQWAVDCGDYDRTESIDMDQYRLIGRSYGNIPMGSIDEFSWTVSTESGIFHTDSIMDWVPSRIREDRIDYRFTDYENGTSVKIYTIPSIGLTYYGVSQYSGNQIYVYTYEGETHSGAYSNYGTHMNAQESITVSILIEDAGVYIGGSVTAEVSDPVLAIESGIKSAYNSQCGWYQLAYELSADYYFANASGVMGSLAKQITPSSEPNEIVLPSRVSLEGNYPNPFNPSTTIAYALPKANEVNITVYDIKGQLIETLISEYQSAGYHTVQLNADNYNSGTYLYVLQSGDFREVRKMILLK